MYEFKTSKNDVDDDIKFKHTVIDSNFYSYCLNYNQYEDVTKKRINDVGMRFLVKCENVVKYLFDWPLYESILLGKRVDLHLKNNPEQTEIFTSHLIKLSRTFGYYTMSLMYLSTFKIDKLNLQNNLIFEQIYHVLDKTFIVLSTVLHHDIYPDYKAVSDYFEMDIKINTTSLIRKAKHIRLGQTFSNCRDKNDKFRIDNSETPRSHIHCYRRCLLTEAYSKFNCFIPFLDFTIHQLDQDYFKDFNVSDICKYEEYNRFEIIRKTTKINELCVNRCPRQCVNVMYHQENIDSDSLSGNSYWFNKSRHDRLCSKRLMWDISQPGYAYIEEAKMTFTDFLVNLGGLMGLWYGLNAHTIIVNIINIFQQTIWTPFLHF